MMLQGKNILCFGSENWNYPGFQQTVMKRLSAENRIIFVNSMGTRKIVLHWSQFNFYLRRILRIFAKSAGQDNRAMVCSPRMIPLVYNNLISILNKQLMGRQFRRLLARCEFEPYILWVGTPTAALILDLFNPQLLVYHAVDRYSEFPFVNRDKIRLYEKKIAQKADVILCTSDAIRKDLSVYNTNTFTVTHAVDFDHFQSALNNDTVPEDLKAISKPIIGYFGGLSERVNFSLIRKTAQRYKTANIVLIGKKVCDLSEVENIPNIHILGYKSYEQLPAYLKQFDVCLIPYWVNDLMIGVDPIKLREYFCLGKPVVSVNLPEVRKYDGLVYIGMDEESFVLKIEEAIKEDNPSLNAQRVQTAKKNDWNVKLHQICDVVFGNAEVQDA